MCFKYTSKVHFFQRFDFHASDECKTRYFKLLYVGFMSRLTRQKVSSMVDKYCKYINVNLIFVSAKVGAYFCTKDSLPNVLDLKL